MDHAITGLLRQMAEGGDVAPQLVAAVIERLERIAHRELAARNHGGLDGLTLEPRIFAHDALLGLIDQCRPFDNRRHFFAYATQIMIRAIIDYRRGRKAQKRGGELVRVSLTEMHEHTVEIEEVPPILSELDGLDQRKADIVRLRVFWGAGNEEIAELMGLSLSTIERDWRFTKRWLATRLREPGRADFDAHDDVPDIEPIL
jgi:RNA polymerase sigma factor (TIGR02999 family)